MPDGQEDDDFVLLEAWCRGDRESGARLYERHYSRVARFFHGKAPEPAQADLLQETFERALKSATRLRNQSSFRAFLLGIAHNVLVDHLRRLSRRMARTAPQQDLEETPAELLGPSPVTTMVQREEQRFLLEALRRIPLIHQVALELYYWEGLKVDEIAEVLEIPRGTARTRLRDGRGHLEAQLRRLAQSPETLRSTLDSLKRWAERVGEACGWRSRRPETP